jgi:hypothetical protein
MDRRWGYGPPFWVYFTIPPLSQILERKIVLARKYDTLHKVTAASFIGLFSSSAVEVINTVVTFLVYKIGVRASR